MMAQAHRIPNPISDKLELIRKIKLPESKKVDKAILESLIEVARFFIEDDKVSADFPIAVGMRKTVKHIIRLYESTKKKDVITRERAERFKLSMTAYLGVALINRDISQALEAPLDEVFSKAIDFLNTLKPTKASSRYARNIETDIRKAQVAKKDIRDGKYVTPGHLRFIAAVLYGIKDTIRMARQDIKEVRALEEKLTKARDRYYTLLELA